MAGLIVAAAVLLFLLFVAARTVRIIPQARAGVVERLGRYSRTLTPGLTIVVPFVDKVKPLIDLREQVVAFPPQPVITQDNVSIGVDTVLYFTITDPKDATYEIANPLQAIEQLTVTTLRNVIGGLTLEETLTSRDNINSQLRLVLDEATGKWGLRINRVEIKSVDPPASIQEAMEKQMRAERDRRASILTAEGVKTSSILTAEGAKQSAVLRAEGDKTSAILRAQGEAEAIDTVFRAIHEGEPDEALLSYQYLQMLPELGKGEANKIFVIPSEFTNALGNLGGQLGGALSGSSSAGGRIKGKPRKTSEEEESAAAAEVLAAAEAAASAAEAAAEASPSGIGRATDLPSLGSGDAEPDAPDAPPSS
jgi:regulator of protease activity HflC (stomatin/prohibitin superfamily)